MALVLQLVRGGWAFDMRSEAGLPLRAAYGAMPGVLKSVGRAGRYAVYMVSKLLGDFDFLCTDVL
eukprot:555293-Pyramimonas_sp.AAC.1